jgi:hypothetical protein
MYPNAINFGIGTGVYLMIGAEYPSVDRLKAGKKR